MYVAEPVHALLNNMLERAKVYRDSLKLDVTVGEDHGEVIRPTFLYTANITLTTIDALAYGFLAKRVMTWTSRNVTTGRYTIPAGLLMNSFLVIDEAHLIQDQVFLGPRILSKIICSLIESGGIVLLSSATIPTSYLNFFNCEKEEIKVPKIDKKVIIEGNINISELPNKIQGGSIVFLNTIERAREVYKNLKKSLNHNYKVLLLHSLLRLEEKNKIIDELDEAQKNKQLDKYILVSTQSAEVGIDYSFNQIYTEISPLDSLIQRFGRVREDKITAYLLDTPSAYPYPEILITKTKDILQKAGSDLDIGDVDNIVSLLDNVYENEVINNLARQGDSHYISAVEYLNNLHLFSYPPDNDVYLRPSFYVTLYVITDKNEFEKILNAIKAKDYQKLSDLLANKSLKVSISLINDYNSKRLDELINRIKESCQKTESNITDDILKCDNAIIKRGGEMILFTANELYDSELGLLPELKEENKTKKGEKRRKKKQG
ncbi:hypothetical protein SJAV_26400 [Sulfurisphaera javensis]|uniref:Helicase C-terminal domain-containing protein n=2 Tax=Sulfurisphaera javensis TaxID=2049879 RepID=A0AAT9GVJ5_9CREN